MSVIRRIQTEFRDLDVLADAAKACDAEMRRAAVGEKLKERVYSREVEGVAVVKLEGWHFPIVVDEKGEVTYDNHNGGWGETARLDELRQCYGEKFTIKQAENAGYRVTDRQVLANKAVQLTLSV